MSVFSVNIEPGSGILGTYKNQSYKLESAFAEFIDNSTQSFFFNRNALLDQGQKSCKITIEIFPEYIGIATRTIRGRIRTACAFANNYRFCISRRAFRR